MALVHLPHLSAPKAIHRQVVVVGLGSGIPGQITPEVDAALRYCDTAAGYSNYVDFIRDRIIGKPIVQNDMMGEVARCRTTFEATAAGQEVCMVCSSNPGILTMAGLLSELQARESGSADIPIRVLPGITAANVAAASLGAPLQNGLSLVSPSDLLVPPDGVRQNLRAMTQSTLPVTLYNPARRKRRHLLTEALDIFRKQRGGDVLCAYVRHARRPQETKWIDRLNGFPADEVDMSTLIIIDGPRAITNTGAMYEAWGYIEKYME